MKRCTTALTNGLQYMHLSGVPCARRYAPTFVVRMLQIALMQIVLEVPDGPRKRKQNKIRTPKTNLKRHQFADVSESSLKGILMDSDISSYSTS